jgi:hypothetical protein
MPRLQRKSFATPDQVHAFPSGRIDLIQAWVALPRADAEPRAPRRFAMRCRSHVRRETTLCLVLLDDTLEEKGERDAHDHDPQRQSAGDKRER